MSTSDATININIDKYKLIANSELLHGLQSLYGVKVAPSRLDILDLKYDKGWLLVSWKSATYGRLDCMYGVPWNLMPDNMKITFTAIVYIKELFNVYLVFVERVPGEASDSYTGFYLDSNGNLSFKSYPSGTNKSITTLSVDDIVFLKLSWTKRDSNIAVVAGVKKYDWDNDTWTDVKTIDWSNPDATESDNFSFKYAALAEQNISTGKLAFFPPAVLVYSPSEGALPDFLRKMRSLGVLADPRTLTFP